MRLLPVAALLAVAITPALFAQTEGDDRVTELPLRRTTTDTFDRPPSIASNDWPWEVSASAGAAWVGGDDLAGSLDMAAQLRLAKYLSDHVYLSGSYLFALTETEFEPLGGGPEETDDHDLHVATVGVGFRFEVTPDVRLFVEPRIGVLFGDADTAPAGGVAGGLELEVTEGIALRFEALGLVTDSSIDTDAGEADIDSVAAFTMGVVFEF
jgi:hypothetical protein